ncbi:MAG: universal stress protein [Chloroflexota bacterium]|nr:universal stress protein [Chloroflexota bacterium]
MYHRILVPLDGSVFAELALDHAGQIAVAGETEVHLVTVAPLLSDQSLAVVDLYPVPAYHDYQADQSEEMQQARGQYDDYLIQVAGRPPLTGHEVKTIVRFGHQPAEEIISYAEDADCDLIVMSTHGRSGIGRWVYGSVADKVLRGSHIPIFLVRAQENSAAQQN